MNSTAGVKGRLFIESKFDFDLPLGREAGSDKVYLTTKSSSSFGSLSFT